MQGDRRQRTRERIFQDDVGMTLGKRRQQPRLMQAMRLLAEGAKATPAAMESGYRTPSAFIFAVQNVSHHPDSVF
jgi:methylphosphotriester-DNA--protein-cysteine methyltransferase